MLYTDFATRRCAPNSFYFRIKKIISELHNTITLRAIDVPNNLEIITKYFIHIIAMDFTLTVFWVIQRTERYLKTVQTLYTEFVVAVPYWDIVIFYNRVSAIITVILLNLLWVLRNSVIYRIIIKIILIIIIISLVWGFRLIISIVVVIKTIPI